MLNLYRLIPDADITYKPNFKQAFADTWPKKCCDKDSKNDWGWSYDVSMDDMAKKMLDNIDDQYKKRLL